MLGAARRSRRDGRHEAAVPSPEKLIDRLRVLRVLRELLDGSSQEPGHLDRRFYLVGFVGQMARLNRGRAFFADPERLGRHALVDFVKNSRQQIA